MNSSLHEDDQGNAWFLLDLTDPAAQIAALCFAHLSESRRGALSSDLIDMYEDIVSDVASMTELLDPGLDGPSVSIMASRLLHALTKEDREEWPG